MERAYLIPQLIEPGKLQEYTNICLTCAQTQQNRRKDPRVSVCFFVCCRDQDLIELRGAAYDLSAGGLALKTNYPIGKGERLTVEFLEPKTLSLVTLEGEVAWRRFHGDNPGREQTLFTAGIKFLSVGEAARDLIWESIQIGSDRASN